MMKRADTVTDMSERLGHGLGNNKTRRDIAEWGKNYMLLKRYIILWHVDQENPKQTTSWNICVSLHAATRITNKKKQN